MPGELSTLEHDAGAGTDDRPIVDSWFVVSTCPTDYAAHIPVKPATHILYTMSVFSENVCLTMEFDLKS
eukprot:2897193-Amphidinium_carterae.2